MDAFKKDFKYYKQRKPPPDLSQVIDFETPEKWKEMVIPVSVPSLNDNKKLTSLGIKGCCEWNVFTIKSNPGFLFIRNPFLKGTQWDLVVKCLKVYSCQPNRTNLDAHMEVKDKIWESGFHSFDKKSPLYKLRWVTLGYHYNWNTKTYNQDSRSDFPPELNKLFATLAHTLGFPNFKPEAGIINYYHLDSTLAGHTDHSEFDLDSPLFSLSLGQSAIFLLGGKSRDDASVAMYMRSGDIMVMAGKSRLAFHAVPRVLSPPNERQSIPSCLTPSSFDIRNYELFSCQSSGTTFFSRNEQREHTGVVSKRKKLDSNEPPEVSSEHSTEQYDSCDRSSIQETELDLIIQYLTSSRININIRQVLKSGQGFPTGQEG